MLGSAYSELTSTTSRMTTYFQRGNSSISAFPGHRAVGPRGPSTRRCGRVPDAAGAAPGGGWESGGLERALGQHVADGGLLYPDAYVVGDLDGDEAVADLAHHAGDAAVGDHLVAVAELVEHGAVFLGALHLR